VSRPGRFELGPRDSLRTLFAIGGGLAPAADSTRALLVRWTTPTQSESIWVQIPQVLAGTYNPPLQQGDHLYVYFVPMFQVSNEAQIQGQVARPGMYPIKLGHDRLSDLVNAAGGFLPSADLASIRVRRPSPTKAEDDPELQRLVRLSRSQLTNYEYDVLNTKLASQREEYRIDWNKVTSTPSLDVLLVNGDIVDVEPLVNSIRIDGQVRRPGILTFTPGKKVEDYVHVAGGFSERAWQSRIRVTRSVTGQTLLARDVQKLDPGDFIWVPERPDITFWQQAQVLLTAAAEVATVVLAFHAIHP
jgi:protein involved in polysaccharide export with SLBB domain